MRKNELIELRDEIEKCETRRMQLALACFDRLTSSELRREILDVFTDREKAAAWLVRKCVALGNMRPIDLIISGESKQVLDELNTIKYGNFA